MCSNVWCLKDTSPHEWGARRRLSLEHRVFRSVRKRMIRWRVIGSCSVQYSGSLGYRNLASYLTTPVSYFESKLRNAWGLGPGFLTSGGYVRSWHWWRNQSRSRRVWDITIWGVWADANSKAHPRWGHSLVSDLSREWLQAANVKVFAMHTVMQIACGCSKCLLPTCMQYCQHAIFICESVSRVCT